MTKHEKKLTEAERRELEIERDALLAQLDRQGGRGVELANEIDRLNEALGEGLGND